MKKRIIIASAIILIILVATIFALYINDKPARDWIDVHILGKDVIEEDLPVVALNADRTNQVYAYSKYLAVLNNKTLKIYNSLAEEVNSIDLDISLGKFNSSENYLAIAEEGGNNICLILDKTYLWSSSVDGEILQIYTNPNGYVAVVTSDATHKSILNVFNPSGKKLFKSYFSSTRIIDISISKDNKYIAIAELDTSGLNVQSNIKILSIENAQKDPDNAIIHTYNANSGNLIANVEYQDKNKILCMYDKSIEEISNNQSETIFKIENDNIAFYTIGFSNSFAYLEEAPGLFKSNASVKIVDTNSKQEKPIDLNDSVKSIRAKDNILEINLGSEIYFYDTNGWLKKRYEANREITEVTFSNSIAGVIYKDKVIVIGF